MIRIKICGIKEETQALEVAEAGADFIGLVFASSPRQVTPTQAKRIVTSLKKNKPALQVVGVFANTPALVVKQVANFCHLDWVQLSGDDGRPRSRGSGGAVQCLTSTSKRRSSSMKIKTNVKAGIIAIL